MKLTKENKYYKNLLFLFLIVIFFSQSLLIIATSIYRNFTYSEYNETILELEYFNFEQNKSSCNLIYKDIKPLLTSQYKDFDFKFISDTKYLRNDIKSIRCIGTVSYVEISTPENYVNIYIGTSKKTFNFISIIFSILFLGIKKLKKDFYIFYLFYFMQHLISYNYFFAQATWQETIIAIVTRISLIYCLEILLYKDFYIPLNKNFDLTYRKEFDGIRALSVIFVILNHLDNTLLPFGYLGVDIFFVLSGYVISNSLSRKSFKNFPTFLADFYIKRFKRLYPTLFLTVIFTYLMFYRFDFYFLSTYLTGLFSLFGLSNLYLYDQSLDYFSLTAKYNSLLHTWSLGVEEQFYIFFPFIFYHFIHKNEKVKNFKFLMLFLFSTSLIYFLYIFEFNFDGAYYLTQARIWQILLGVIIFLFQNHRSINFNFDKNLIILILLLIFIIFGSTTSLNPHILISILTGLLVLKSNNNRYSDRILNTKFLKNIGLISYALYLWHLPFLTFKYWNNNILPDLESEILLILFFSLGTFYFLDIPIRVKSFTSKYKKSYILIFLIFIFVTVTALTIPSASLTLTEKVDINETPVYKLLDCHLPQEIDQVFDDCLNFQKEKTNIILLGDSHVTNHYFPIKSKFENENVGLLVEWSFIGSFIGQDLCVGNRVCTKNSLEDYIKVLDEKLLPDDIVVLAFSNIRVSEGNKEIFIENLIRLINVVKKNRSLIYLVDDIPKPCLNVDLNYELEVLVKRNLEICTINIQNSKISRGLYSEIIKNISDGNIVKYIDPHDYLCEKEKCNLSIDNQLLYADSSPHLTKVGADFLNNFWNSVDY